MEAIDVAKRYFDAWNDRDSGAIAATLAEDGTYTDPTSGGPLNGKGLIEYTIGLFSAFPDLSFDIVSAAPAGENMAVAQWLMRGTNTGPIMGLLPTGQSVALPGADFITVKGDKIRSVQGYFDQKTFVEQLGLQAIVQPYSFGPVSFGTCVYMPSGNRTKPGAFSITSLRVRSDEEAQETQGYGRRIFQEMAQMPGFIGTLTANAGTRLFTITAWEDTEALKQLLRGGAHKEAMDRFYGPDFAVGGMVSVWVPDHIREAVRCTSCGRMVAASEEPQENCSCGQVLPQRPLYW